jgi:hypothetical protein
MYVDQLAGWAKEAAAFRIQLRPMSRRAAMTTPPPVPATAL